MIIVIMRLALKFFIHYFKFFPALRIFFAVLAVIDLRALLVPRLVGIVQNRPIEMI